MYNITKLSSASQDFVTKTSGSGKSRSTLVSLALARAIASALTIPTSPVESIEQEYRNMAQMKVEKDLSALNELLPIDLKTAQSFVQAFYKLRYNMVHPERTVFSFREERTVEDFFGLTRVFGDETLDIVRNEGTELSYLCNGFRGLLMDIDESYKRDLTNMDKSTVPYYY